MIRAMHGIAFAAALLIATSAAHAGLMLCNRTSYRLEAAIGLAKHAHVATRGWFAVDPGACRQVTNDMPDADVIYLHTRTPALYGRAPAPRTGNAELCIRDGDFDIADGRSCPITQQARFSAAHPSDAPQGPTIYVAEDAAYDDAQARLAGIQRLLTIAGYDAYPIDGVAGSKTQSALAKFLSDRKLPADAAEQPDFFATLIKAAADPQGPGFSWCNDTRYDVMAAIGTVEMGSIVTRGWYRVASGQCVRPDLRGGAHRLYSFAEAVDAGGRTVRRGEDVLSWGGKVVLCTRDGRFELSNQKDCAARGLNAAGFALVDAGSGPAAVVHFKEP
jgi:uncharacterized membrane protein